MRSTVIIGQVDRPTDVISFAACDDQDEFELIEEAEVELGDIFINVEAAISQAEEYGHSLRREICFLFTHGLLHCFGYRPHAARMRKRSCSICSMKFWIRWCRGCKCAR